MEPQPVLRPPQQQRSRQTLERILSAAREVVAEDGFEQAAVSEITARAGVAVGTFYTRFENKDALLHALHEAQTAEDRERIALDLTTERWAGHTVREILDELVRGSMELARSIAGFQRACYQRALTDSLFAERELAVRRELVDRMKDLIGNATDEILHPDPERAAKFCAELYVAVVTEHINAEAFSASDFTDDEVAAELIDAMCAYLRVSDA